MTPPENYNKAVETLQARLKEAAETWAKAAADVAEWRLEHDLNEARSRRAAYKQEYQDILNDLRELQNAVYPAHYVNLPGAEDVPPVVGWGRPVFSMPGAVDIMGGIASPVKKGCRGGKVIIDDPLADPDSSVGDTRTLGERLVDAAPEILRRLETETPRPWVPPSENK